MTSPVPVVPIVLDGLFDASANLPVDGWKPFHAGIDCYPIYETPNGGPAAMLLRYAPGATAPVHRHEGYEHIFVLSGSQTDERGRHEAGSFMVQPAGTDHHVHSEDGCVVLAIWERRVRFLP
jgi:anti-sigma factor ChrR (cupin superfamily)